MRPPTLTTADASRELGVTDRTVRLWVASGALVADMKTVGGHARFYFRTLLQFQQKLRLAAARSRAA